MIRSWSFRVGKAVFLSVAFGLIGTEFSLPTASAMHENDHRFTISGYVRAADGKPMPEARVYVRNLRDQKIESVTTYTDGKGFYKAVLHLHNDNAGDTIQVSVRHEKAGLEDAKDIRAEFNPRDAKAERQAQVNFGPSSSNEADGSERQWLYLIGGSLIGTAVLAAVLWRRRSKSAAEAKRRRKKR